MQAQIFAFKVLFLVRLPYSVVITSVKAKIVPRFNKSNCTITKVLKYLGSSKNVHLFHKLQGEEISKF